MTLAIPADPAYIGTVRLFAATVARHADLEEEPADDLRLAVSEACAEAIEAGAIGSVRVALSLEPDGVTAEVGSEPARPEWGAPVHQGSELVRIDRLQLIRALFPDAATDQARGRRVVRFAVRAEGTPRT